MFIFLRSQKHLENIAWWGEGRSGEGFVEGERDQEAESWGLLVPLLAESFGGMKMIYVRDLSNQLQSPGMETFCFQAC